jgi:hypothetical protein
MTEIVAVGSSGCFAGDGEGATVTFQNGVAHRTEASLVRFAGMTSANRFAAGRHLGLPGILNGG